jgi:mono/diheme cytochrome c family protein
MASMTSMKKLSRFLVLVACCCTAGISTAFDKAAEHGKYVFFAAGCISSHTADEALAGGRPLESPFGTFYPPNITPSREYGIGTWDSADLKQALRRGINPAGRHYYPAFPYPSYTRMTGEDIEALYAYLMQQPPAARQNRPHELHWPFSSRPLIANWKAGGFTPGAFSSHPDKSTQWNRGAYLANALGHCSECHTPRGFLGIPRADRHLAGTCDGPDGKLVPNITPDRQTGIGNWTCEELTRFLGTGRKPDGSFTGSLMAEVIGTSCMRLTAHDRRSLAIYLQTVPPIHHDLKTLCAPFDDLPFYE